MPRGLLTLILALAAWGFVCWIAVGVRAIAGI